MDEKPGLYELVANCNPLPDYRDKFWDLKRFNQWFLENVYKGVRS
jgi:hypothetical protein